MKRVVLTRGGTSDLGTFGKLTSDDFSCITGELPWLFNREHVSCIPTGTYEVQWRFSKKHGMCYHLLGVPARSDIEIHSGNFCGNKSAGLKSDVLGCILLGDAIGTLDKQKAVMNSNAAVLAFCRTLNYADFELVVGWGIDSTNITENSSQ